MSQTKTCSKCKETKGLDEFYKSSTGKYGVSAACKACKLEYQKKHYKANADQRKEYNKTYREENKEKTNEHKKHRRKTDPLFKLAHNTRILIGKALKNKGYSKTSRNHEILGCSFEDLYTWLNTKANNELTPYDDTHTDHVIPVSWGKTEEEVLALNHYSNLQLLSPEENMTKGDSAPLPENYERVLANHPHPDIIERIYASRISKI